MSDEDEQYKHLKGQRVCFPVKKTITALSMCDCFATYSHELKSLSQKSGRVKAHMENRL